MLEMPRHEIDAFLAKARVGHLGLARGGDAYVVPLFFRFDGKDTLYFHSHPGAKDEYIRATKEACFTVTRAAGDDEWRSVELFGAVTKIISDPEKLAAMDALTAVPFPPEWGFTPDGMPRQSGARSYFWKLTIRRASGRTSEPRRESVRRGIEAIAPGGLEADFATD